MLKPAQSKRVY